MDEYTNLVFEIACSVSTLEKKVVGFWIILFPFKGNMKKIKIKICYF